MNTLRSGLLLLAAALWAGTTLADPPGYRHGYYPHSSIHFGFNVGAPWGYPAYYPYPAYWPRYYSPPVLVTTSPPPVYIEQAPPAVYVEQAKAESSVPKLEPGFWYYCREAQAYYPYVKQCQGSWQKVAPQTVPQQSAP